MFYMVTLSVEDVGYRKDPLTVRKLANGPKDGKAVTVIIDGNALRPNGEKYREIDQTRLTEDALRAIQDAINREKRDAMYKPQPLPPLPGDK